MRQKFFCNSSLVSIAALAIAAPAQAQESASADQAGNKAAHENSIVVTATKRATDLQATPLAVSAVSGDDLAARQASNLEALSTLAPNVNFGQTTGNARINIRGVGYDNISVGNEGRTAFHVDGVYISRPGAQLGALYDLERVEVLRGPQGILYGRNATGGAVNVITRGPTDALDGYVEATVGNYNLFKFNAAVGGPVSDTVSARIAGEIVDRGGYGRNVTLDTDIDDRKTRAFRGQVRFEPSEDFSLNLSGDYFEQNDHAFGFLFMGAGSPPDPSTNFPGVTPRGIAGGGFAPADRRDSSSDIDPVNIRKYWGLNATAEFSLGGVDVTSITGYRSNDSEVNTDIDATNIPVTLYNQFERGDHFSQELRLSGTVGPADWMLGGFYFDENVEAATRIPATAPFIPAGPNAPMSQGIATYGVLDTEAYAIFGNVTLSFTDELRLNGGLRYSHEKKSVDEAIRIDFITPFPPFLPVPPQPTATAALYIPQVASKSWSDTSPSLTLEYEPNSDLFFYLTYAKGFKSGAYNVGNSQPPVEPEEVTDIEGGIRADWLDGVLRTNISAFHYDYSNLQVSIVRGTALFIENAASAEVYGLEAEVTVRPTDNLTFESTLALLNAEYTAFDSLDPARPDLGIQDLSGNKLNQAPDYTFTAAFDYTIPSSIGDFTLRGEGFWTDGYYFSQFNKDSQSNPSYSTFNAFVRWENESGFYANAFIRNITNKEVVSAQFVTTSLAGNTLVGTLQPPRTFGITLGKKF